MKSVKKGNSVRSSSGRRRGAVMYVVAGSLVALMGFAALAVDFGLLTTDANRLQRGVDAAALAGATCLKTSGNDAVDVPAAINLAVDVAARNGVTVNRDEIVVSANSAGTPNARIRVPATYQRSLLFARVLGISNGTVGRAATAEARGLTTGPGPRKISPIGISASMMAKMAADFALRGGTDVYDQQLVDHKKESFDSTKFMLFDLRSQPAKSPEHMRRQLVGESNETIFIGDEVGDSIYETVLNASGGAQYKKYADAMAEIFNRAAQSPWFDTPVSGSIDNAIGIDYQNLLNGIEPAEHPRVLHVLVTPDSPPVKGTYDAHITNVQRVYVERVYNDGREYRTVFRYLPPLTHNPNAVGGGSGFLLD